MSDINLDTLHGYYNEKFDYDSSKATDAIRMAEEQVDLQYQQVKLQIERQFVMTEAMVRTYIKRLRHGCAAGIDGISAEHLEWSKESPIITTLCNMLTVCSIWHCGKLIFERIACSSIEETQH